VPFAYSIDVNSGMMIVRGEGVVTKEELFSTAVAMFSDRSFHPELRLLVDLTALKEKKFSPVDAWAAGSLGKFSPNARRAFLLKGRLAFRFYWALKESVTFHGKGSPKVFYSRTKALAWLNEGVPPDKVWIGGVTLENASKVRAE
jgi:hypothetical protein